MRRRDVLIGLGIAVALPASVRAQQTPPAIGFLSAQSPDEAIDVSFRSGLQKAEDVQGSGITIEYRWANGDYDKLPSLAADLLSRPLALLVAVGDPAAMAAKAATPATPVVFLVGRDPVQEGLVASMNRPGTTTGINILTGDLGGKRLGLLCAMVPSARVVGLLINPGVQTDERRRQLQAVVTAAKELDRELVVQDAATDDGIEAAFAAFARAGAATLMLQNDSFFDSRRNRIVALSASTRLPGIFHIREYPENGGLMSYGANLSYNYRQLGV
jgi:putative ABC transport system substrate-binding protein